MSGRLTDKACKAIIIGVAKKFNVEPKLITTRLMSEDDKNDMRDGNLSHESFECHVKVWIRAGMPDYVHGKTEPLAEHQQRVII